MKFKDVEECTVEELEYSIKRHELRTEYLRKVVELMHKTPKEIREVFIRE